MNYRAPTPITLSSDSICGADVADDIAVLGDRTEEYAHAAIYFGLPNSTGSWRGPRTVLPDHMTSPPIQLEIRNPLQSHSSRSATRQFHAREVGTDAAVMPRPNAAWRFSLAVDHHLVGIREHGRSRLAAGNEQHTCYRP